MLTESATPEKDLQTQTEPGVSALLDGLAATAAGAHGFLRAAWFRGSVNGSTATTLVSTRASGVPVAAVPLVARKLGPFSIREVPGSYWPFRSFPIAADASVREIGQLLGSSAAVAAFGNAWRLGPIYSNDPTGKALTEACESAGWTVLKRSLGTCYVIDLKRLRAEGQWPSVKTLRKNRWCERRLAELGELDFRTISGSDWDETILDTLAAIEEQSWVGTSGSTDAKFLNPENRRMWKEALTDPGIAEMLRANLIYVDGEPAAFAFSIQCGSTRHYIANSYSERFAQFSAGRILLYRDFQQAAEAGVETIGWGAGDPGYKSEMGAEPGPAIDDYLIVRGRLLGMLARPIWTRRN